MRATRSIVSSLLITACSLPWPAVQANALLPVTTRGGETPDSVYLDTFIDYVDGALMQEAENVRAWTVGVNLSVPIRHNMQVRLLVPIRTEGNADLIETGDSIDIEGFTGLYDFLTVQFEHQLVGSKRDGASNFGYYFGVGFRTDELKTGTHDSYHHEGRYADTGVRYDYTPEAGRSRFLVDAGVRFYERSDDLNPGDDLDDTFWLALVRGAWLWEVNQNLAPGFELLVDGGVRYFSASLVPQINYRTGEQIDLKLGIPVGLSSDAPSYGVQARLTVNF